MDAAQLPDVGRVTPSVVVQYGSARQDIDLLIVLPSGAFRAVRSGRYDCLFVSEDELTERCTWRDIALTEPVATGTVVAGSAEKLAPARAALVNEVIPHRDVADYCFRRASVEFAVARAILSEWVCAETLRAFRQGSGAAPCPVIGDVELAGVRDRFSDTLGYAVSYSHAALHYRTTPALCVFKAMLDASELLRAVRALHSSRAGGSLAEARRLMRSARSVMRSEL